MESVAVVLGVSGVLGMVDVDIGLDITHLRGGRGTKGGRGGTGSRDRGGG